jgi:hypothetical protein
LYILLLNKTERCKESYDDESTGKERMGIALLKAGMWKMREIRRGFQKVVVPHITGGKGRGLKCKM